MLPSNVRGVGLGLVLGVAGAAEMLTPFVAQWLISVNTLWTIIIYALIGTIGGIIAACLPLETRGRPLLNTVTSRFLPEDFKD